MSAQALALIAEAKKNRSTRLDLGNCGLSELPDELFELTWLEELILSNEWTEYSFKKNDWEVFNSQNKGEENNIKFFSPKIKSLRELKKLVANGEKLSDISSLLGLTQLQMLYVSNTKVSDLSPLIGLTQLQMLDVFNTKVSDLSPLIRLIQLQRLEVSRTQVSDLSPLKGLTKLQQLNVSFTKVSDLSPLNNLEKLQKIFLHNSKFSDLYPLKPLIENEFNVIWNDYINDDLYEKGITVENCPLINPPIEIVMEGNEAILNYWKQQEEQGGAEDINESKLIIVGEGGTGKTTLFEKLKDPNHNPITNPTAETHGINILEGLHIGKDFHANLWDFGGQELQYMTHQFFLTPRALYVLMMDARKESPNLSYWFKIISLLDRESDSEKAQVLLVFNKRKGTTGIPLYHDLLKYYEEDFDSEFMEVDFAENNYRWDHLKNCIEERLESLAISLPKQWKPIREGLREEALKHPHISMERFSEICSIHQVTEEESQLLGSRTLHKLGQILHFNEKGLRSHIILSPKWAVEAVYCFLGNESIVDKAGRFTENDFIEILGKKGYKSNDADLILQLMTRNHFDICYQSKDGNYVAAQLLPDNRPVQFKWHPEVPKGGALQFRYQYPTMPKGLISRLIVRLSSDIEVMDKVEIVWKKGAILRIEKDGQTCRVLIQEDDAESKSSLRQIKIEVMGEPSYRKFALQKVRDEVEDLHKKWFRNIHADEIVPCCCEECRNAKTPEIYVLKDLLKLMQRSTTRQCLSGNNVSIIQLLEGIYNEKEIKELSHQVQYEKRVERHIPDIHVHIENNPQFINTNQTVVRNEEEIQLIKALLDKLTTTQKETLKTEVQRMPNVEESEDKEYFGNKIIKWLNQNAEGIVGNVAASVYYDGLKFLFGIG